MIGIETGDLFLNLIGLISCRVFIGKHDYLKVYKPLEVSRKTQRPFKIKE